MARKSGATSYLGVPLGTLNRFLREDAVIHVSKKFLQALGMITEGHDGQNTGNRLPIVSKLEKDKEKELDKVALKVDKDW
ncbi:MAG TPA: hypothetical protein EYO99_02845 [Candidatus Marinimicrobia bacterium]|nr:hypothetical protein [Candidatus Neomarinimicrobiota bacterium]